MMKRMIPRWAPLFTLLVLLPAGALGAQGVRTSQFALVSSKSLLSRPAKLDVTDVSIENALTTLRQHADVNIVFSPSLLPSSKRVSCRCTQSTVEEALETILAGTGFKHFEMPLQIVIRAPDPLVHQQSTASLGVPSFTFATLAPRVTASTAANPVLRDSVITGIVVRSITGEPLSNAIVSVVGSNRSTITDAQGRFRIAGLHALETVVLQVRLIGFAPVTRSVPVGAVNVTIAMEAEAIVLEGVVVSALGIGRERRALGYSVSSVDAQELSVNRTPNFVEALQGKMAGVNISSMGSGPQGSVKVRIRGQSSFGGTNSPLVVINGVPIDNTSFGVSGDVQERGSNRNSDSGDGLSSINPDDIVDMTVLKGAAAAALYGSRAKDGVIMITTRNRASSPGISWQFTSSATHEAPLDFRDYQMEYGQGEGGKRPNGQLLPGSGTWSFGERFRPGMTQVLFDGVEVPYEPQPNQFREYYRNGLNLTNTITVSNSGENGGVSASLSNLRSRAVLPYSNYSRNTVNVGFTQIVAERYTISGNVNYAHENRDNPPNIAEQDYSPVVIYTLSTSMPMSLLKEKAFTSEGNEMYWSRFTNRTNPYFALSRFENNTRDRIFGNVTARVELTDWMFAQGRVGQDYYSRNQEYNLPTGSQRQAPAPAGFVNGEFVQDNMRVREINADFLLGINRRFREIGANANLGGNLMRRRQDRSNVLVQDFYTRGVYTLNNGRLQNSQHTLLERQVNSLYGQAEVSYRDMLFLSGTLRNDWFSTLSQENRSILYPSVSASFVFTDALGMPDWISFGKLRAAYAMVGSDTDVAPYSSELFYAINPNLFNNRPVGSVSGTIVPNPGLRPMRMSEWEVGLETTLLGRINLDVGFYERISKDQILSQQVSTASGFSTRLINIGKSRNHGVELLANTTPIRRDRFSWTSTANMSYNSSKVLDLGTEVGVDQITVGGADFHGELRQVVGKPLNQLFGWGWLRDEQGRQVFDPVTGIPLRSKEQLNFGSAIPVWVGGFSNRFEFGSLSAAFLIDYKLGHKLISGTHINAVRHGLDKSTLPGREEGCVIGDGVNPDGSPNTVCTPVQTYYEAIRTHQTSEQSVFNAGSWQVRQISIGYDLTRYLPARAKISAMNVNLVANNVAVLKSWVPHIHPDQNGIISDARMGLEATGLPVTRGFGLNVNMRF